MALQNWLEEVYRDHASALFRFLIRVTGNETETKDILQEVFVRLAKSPSLLDGVPAPRSYLFRLAHRLAIDHHRRNETRQRNEDHFQHEQAPSCDPDLAAQDTAWMQRTLGSSLDGLPPDQKAVVALKVWEEMTFAQIAEILDISPNTAASRYRYALDKLREALRPHYGDLP
jgi:RNA polymerase sigma-70 factor (ECF subfamily)